MSPDPIRKAQWPRIRELFLAALEKPADERTDFVQQSEPDAAVRAHGPEPCDAF